MRKVNAKELQAMLRKLAAQRFKAEDFRRMAQIAREEREAGFQASTGPDGSKWRPLAESTVRKKSGAHGTTRIRKGVIKSSKARASATPDAPLIDTGALSKPTIHTAPGKGIVRVAGSRAAAVWNGKSISQIHDEGTGKIPRRRHWGIYPRAKERIEEFANRTLNQKVKEIMG